RLHEQGAEALIEWVGRGQFPEVADEFGGLPRRRPGREQVGPGIDVLLLPTADEPESVVGTVCVDQRVATPEGQRLAQQFAGMRGVTVQYAGTLAGQVLEPMGIDGQVVNRE